MCSNEIAIQVSGLSKAYRIFERPSQRLSHYLFGTKDGSNFWALRNVNFEIKKGETFGIIGKNGSGKSTMLQLLAGIIKQTEGEMGINGKVAALLELGSGFNPEDTGRENIYVNSAILGVSRDEIESKIQKIIEFADIGSFIDEPVKSYSSGMYIRLAFAVAINVNADIILIDEALAVGDVFFRQKCYTQLNEIRDSGKTIILVSHAMNEVEQFCDRALLLDKGEQIMLGDSRDVVRQYYLLDQKKSIESVGQVQNNSYSFTNDDKLGGYINNRVFCDLSKSNEISNGKATIIRVGLFDKDGNPAYTFEQGEDAFFYYEFFIKADIQIPIVGTMICNHKNIIVHGKNTMQTYTDVPQKVRSGSIIKVWHKTCLAIELGEYSFEVGLSEMPQNVFEKRSVMSNEDMFAFEQRIVHRSGVGTFSVVLKKVGMPSRLTHHGVCDLATEINISIESSNQNRG